MKNILRGFVGVIMAVILIAAASNFDAIELDSYLSAGTYVKSQTEVSSPEFVLGSGSSVDSLGRMVMYVRNKSGATLAIGRVVSWDTTEFQINEIKVLPNVAWTDTGSAFTTEGAPNGIKIVGNGTPSNDSVYIYGTAITGTNTIASTSEVFNLGTTANDIRYSGYLWDSIDSIKVDSGAAAGVDSLSVSISPFRGVKMAVAADLSVAGVVLESIADNAVGQICVYGEALVRTKPGSATYIRNGWPLVAGASGTALPVPAAQFVADSINTNYNKIGYGLGTKDDVADSSTIWMFVNIP